VKRRPPLQLAPGARRVFVAEVANANVAPFPDARLRLPMFENLVGICPLDCMSLPRNVDKAEVSEEIEGPIIERWGPFSMFRLEFPLRPCRNDLIRENAAVLTILGRYIAQRRVRPGD